MKETTLILGAAQFLRTTVLNNPYIPHEPHSKQAQFLVLPHREVMYGGAAGGGKAQILKDLIYTPFGAKKIGDIKVDDTVCTPDGSVSKVIAIYPQGETETYRLIFDDGAEVTTSGEHLWLYHEAGKSKGRLNGLASQQIATTRMLSEKLKAGKRPIIPLSEPVFFAPNNGRWGKNRPIHPYVLGVLLGDGSIKKRAMFCSFDNEISDKVEILIDEDKLVKYDNGNFAIVGNTLGHLRKLGLLGKGAGDKYIPKYYKQSPINDRWALLQGLMDTDGYIDTRGHISYVTISNQLALDVQWLFRSLGFKCTLVPKLYGQEMSTAYTLYAKGSHSDKVFSLSRKKSRVCAGQNRYRRLVRIIPQGRQPTVCIKIDNPDGLYLTNDFVITHNSDALLMAALQFIQISGYSALLLRRTFADLSKPGALIPRSKEWLLPTNAKWNDQTHAWYFPCGSVLSFGYLQYSNDIYQYQSAEYQFIGFDELTQFEENQYRYLFSRLRKLEGVNIPLRMRSATNPGGVGHAWVKRRFIDDESKVFIPGKLEDNPSLDRAEYEESLSELDPITRKQLRHGDWEVRPAGEVLNSLWFEVCLLYTSPSPRDQRGSRMPSSA